MNIFLLVISTAVAIALVALFAGWLFPEKGHLSQERAQHAVLEKEAGARIIASAFRADHKAALLLTNTGKLYALSALGDKTAIRDLPITKAANQPPPQSSVIRADTQGVTINLRDFTFPKFALKWHDIDKGTEPILLRQHLPIPAQQQPAPAATPQVNEEHTS